ncbi:MAG: hypothetical protein WC867_05900 [Candidatus Pacearchaeota archaeon]
MNEKHKLIDIIEKEYSSMLELSKDYNRYKEKYGLNFNVRRFTIEPFSKEVNLVYPFATITKLEVGIRHEPMVTYLHRYFDDNGTTKYIEDSLKPYTLDFTKRIRRIAPDNIPINSLMLLDETTISHLIELKQIKPEISKSLDRFINSFKIRNR